MEYLRDCVDFLLQREFVTERFDWSHILETRSVNYALPYRAIGRVSALEFAEGVVLELLQNPVDHCLAGWPGMDVKSSRVIVRDDDWDDLARGLVAYGICCVIPASAVAKRRNRLLQNGLLGVAKNEDVTGLAVHHLNMNLILFNSISHSVAGAVGTLPLLHQMSAMQVHADEVSS